LLPCSHCSSQRAVASRRGFDHPCSSSNSKKATRFGAPAASKTARLGAAYYAPVKTTTAPARSTAVDALHKATVAKARGFVAER